MSNIINVSDLIALWPNRQSLADDLRITVDRVHKWVGANSIPAKYHAAILDSAQAREFVVDANKLVEIHRREEKVA